MSSVDGVIFDVDGTIWDSTPVVMKAWNRALSECGYNERVTADRLKGLFGLPMLDIIADILPWEKRENMESFLELCSRYEFEYLDNEAGTVYDGMEETLKQLSERYKLAIVSNCQAGYIELMFNKTGFAKYFQLHLCPGDTGQLKAGNIMIAAKRCGMNNPIYVGDTHMDENASREAGVKFVHAAYGFGKAENPDASICAINELVNLLEDSYVLRT